MKHQVIAMKKHNAKVSFQGYEFNMTLPPGCTGVLFVFESKKAARKYWGNDIELMQIEEVEPK